jgi:hypothetical protein
MKQKQGEQVAIEREKTDKLHAVAKQKQEDQAAQDKSAREKQDRMQQILNHQSEGSQGSGAAQPPAAH